MGKAEGCKGGDDCRDPKHLCKIAKKEQDFGRVRELVRGAEFYCGKCGRAARSPANLCKPEKI